ncbi:MAG TPA: response regulator transcription factor [Bacillota bacterium]|nr:response regulator transcription factor [Bacillota bacterium]
MERYILIADDHEGIVDILGDYLSKAGYIPIKAYDGEAALVKFKQFAPLLVLLDVMMPKKDGWEVCKEIRKSSNTPIIMITARGEDVEKIMGLEIGADDYVVKPFSPGEIVARVKAVLRRIVLPEDTKKTFLKVKQLEIDLEEYQVKVDQQLLNLTKKEVEILWLLASNPNKVFSRNHLLDSVWGYDYYGDDRTVDTHIKRLRAKLALPGKYEWDIKTIWGVGYKFEVEDD